MQQAKLNSCVAYEPAWTLCNVKHIAVGVDHKSPRTSGRNAAHLFETWRFAAEFRPTEPLQSKRGVV
jgi:hypothetical protein